MKDYKTYEGSLYHYTGSVNVGVLVKESTMKRLATLEALHLDNVKRLLHDEGDRGNVFPSMWTLHHPEGKQTVVNFIDETRDLNDSIRCATNSGNVQHKPLVFIASSMKEAQNMADNRFIDMHHEELAQKEG
jgi:hypothetical protein